MIGFIYYLKNPITNEVIYIGSTTVSLKERLRNHYAHLLEAVKLKRKMNPRLKYLQDLLPTKVRIELLEIVDEEDLDWTEQLYIGVFKSWGYNLLNMTDGGRGGFTWKYFNTTQRAISAAKISFKNKGRKMPSHNIQLLKESRLGINNPAAGKSKIGPVICFKDNMPLMMFKYGFEVNSFIGKKDAWSNVAKAILQKDRENHKPYGYQWKKFSECDSTIQDIVRSQYENTDVVERIH